MEDCFHLCVMNAEGTVLNGQASYCSIPTATGSVGVLANHAPMICALREGETLCRMEDGTEKTVRHTAGVAAVGNNEVTILIEC